jgi:hypoxanthine phosphoribosyltransferase
MSLNPPVFISEPAILARVSELAGQVSQDYRTVDEVFLVGVLRGAFIFLADLSRRLTVPRRVDFVAVSAYEDGTVPCETVRIVSDLRSDIRGRHVLVVEDIVDTGRTLRCLVDLLADRAPASLRSCVLVRKPSRIEVPVPIDYLGFDIPDVWVVGYGLDCADRHRTLPYIGIIQETPGAASGTIATRPPSSDRGPDAP